MIEIALTTVALNFNVVTLVAAFVAAGVNAAVARGGFAEQLFRWTMLLNVGLTGIFTFIVHVFMPERSAANIGWEVSPFQYEVGIADLTVGVLGVLAFRRDQGFRCAATVATCCWLLGCAAGHVYQMMVAKNFAPGNAGVWFWTSPTTSLIVAVTFRLSNRSRNDGGAASSH